MANQTCGEIVRNARLRRSISREALAYRVEVSVSTIARLELHDKVPKASTLKRIATVLQIPVDELMDRVPA